MANVSIAFSYTDDPLVRAALGGFNVYPVDDVYDRLAEAIEVAPDSIPTASSPLTVPMPPDATQVEVVPLDAQGYEGATTYIPVQLGLPPVLSVSQIIMVMTHPVTKKRDLP
jgi:hypothetical protein